MENRNVVGERLKLLRGKRTQEDIARAIGITRARYSHYENGIRDLDNEMMKKIADYHNTTTDYILGRTDDPNPQKESITIEEAFSQIRNQIFHIKDKEKAEKYALEKSKELILTLHEMGTLNSQLRPLLAHIDSIINDLKEDNK